MWTQVGKRIEKIRKERNMSKARFGKLIGVSGQHIGMVEKGKGISVELIIKIYQATGVSADFILLGIIESNHVLTTSAALQGLSHEQIEIALEIIKNVARFINTDDGNEALIQEVIRQQQIKTSDEE